MDDRHRRILWHIWKNQGVCRKEIATAVGIHPNLVSDAVRALIEEGWLAEGEPRSGGSGRAPVPLHLDLEKRAALSASYTSQRMICALVNAAGEIIREVASENVPDKPANLVEVLGEALSQLKAGYSGQVIGIGVADPGMIDSVKGEIVRSSTFPEWHHVPLASLLEQRMNLMVLLEDTTRTRAVAQYLAMPKLLQTGSSMLYLDYGDGTIGFALVVPNGIWHGAGFAAELGHVVMQSDGPLCRCGARGCLESLANSVAVEAKAKALLAQGVNSILRGQENPSAAAIFSAASDGDRMARNVVDGIMSALGLATAFIVGGFHPQYFVVGGESKATIRCLTAELFRFIRDRILPEVASSIEVVEGQESRRLALTGAGLMVFERAIMPELGVLLSEGSKANEERGQ